MVIANMATTASETGRLKRWMERPRTTYWTWPPRWPQSWQIGWTLTCMVKNAWHNFRWHNTRVFPWGCVGERYAVGKLHEDGDAFPAV